MPPLDNLQEASEYALVRLIVEDWKNVNYAARPYLEAMANMAYAGRSYIRDAYGADYPGECVLYFLSNASSWRGETAKAVKAELKRRMR